MSGVLNVLLAPTSSGAAAYVGPGDVVASALGWWGLRGYSAAYSTGSNAAIDIVDTSSANAATINILSTGSLDMSALNTWIGSFGTAFIVKFYDQSGNGVHLTCAKADAPQIATGVLGSLAVALYSKAQGIGNAIGITSGGEPVTDSYVCNRTVAARGSQGIVIQWNGGPQDGFSSTNDTALIFSGNVLTATAADGSFHAFQITHNGASSEIYVDGSGTSGNAGASFPLGKVFLGSDAASGSQYGGYICEAGIWQGAFSAGNKTSMNSNQHTYWGF